MRFLKRFDMHTFIHFVITPSIAVCLTALILGYPIHQYIKVYEGTYRSWREIDCNTLASSMNMNYMYDRRTGCYLQHNGIWMPKEHINFVINVK